MTRTAIIQTSIIRAAFFRSAAICALFALGACAYSSEELYSESEGQITVSSSGVVQQQQASLREARPENAPVAIIRFDQPEVAYGGPLGELVGKLRARNPDTGFDVVAVSPSIGPVEQVAILARRGRERGEQVYATLLDMGVPPARLTLASTVSPAVTVNEVHIYIGK